MALRKVLLELAANRARFGPRLVFSRNFRLWSPPSPPELLPDHVISEVTKLTRGVGFTVIYSDTSSSLWFCGENPPIGGEKRGHVQEVCLPKGHVTKMVSVGRRHVLAMTTAGNVFAMGLNCFGQCGFLPNSSSSTSSNDDDLVPLQQVQLPLPAVKVCSGLDHTHFLLDDGRLFSCGWSDDGQTGTGCHGSVAPPTPIKSEESVRGVFCCADTTIVMTRSSLYGWGNNEYKQLPIESHDMQVFVPWRINPISDQSDEGKVVTVAMGSSFSAALTQYGAIYVAGRLGGVEEEGGWRLLHDSRTEEEEVVEDIRAGLHYLAAVVSLKVKGHKKLLLWGRPSVGSPQSLLPREIVMPPSLLDWDAGPLDISFLMQ